MSTCTWFSPCLLLAEEGTLRQWGQKGMCRQGHIFQEDTVQCIFKEVLPFYKVKQVQLQVVCCNKTNIENNLSLKYIISIIVC